MSNTKYKPFKISPRDTNEITLVPNPPLKKN